MSGYPSSALYVWDPGARWTANISETPFGKPLAENAKDANPRRLMYMNKWAGTHKMWTATTGGDGKAYFGGRWYRNGEGGGLAWFDPKTGQGGGLAEPFTTFQIAYMTTASDGRYIVMSTICARDQTGKLPTPEHAKVFVFDTQVGKLVRDFVPVQNATRSGAIAGVGGPFILGLTFDPSDRPAELKPEEQDPYLKGRTLTYGLRDQHSILYKANVETGEVLWRKKLPYPVGFRTNENFAHQDGFDFKLGPDGMVWTFSGARFNCVNPKSRWHYAYTNCRAVEDEKTPEGFRLDGMNCALVRIEPKDGRVHVVGKVTHTGAMAFVGKDLYLGGGDKYLIQHNKYLRRLRNIVP
jgi:outer membrane protein assembly factor BamB